MKSKRKFLLHALSAILIVSILHSFFDIDVPSQSVDFVRIANVLENHFLPPNFDCDNSDCSDGAHGHAASGCSHHLFPFVILSSFRLFVVINETSWHLTIMEFQQTLLKRNKRPPKVFIG